MKIVCESCRSKSCGDNLKSLYLNQDLFRTDQFNRILFYNKLCLFSKQCLLIYVENVKPVPIRPILTNKFFVFFLFFEFQIPHTPTDGFQQSAWKCLSRKRLKRKWKMTIQQFNRSRKRLHHYKTKKNVLVLNQFHHIE